jgi:hypothetical protein
MILAPISVGGVDEGFLGNAQKLSLVVYDSAKLTIQMIMIN